jgi:hypothetical protein
MKMLNQKIEKWNTYIYVHGKSKLVKWFFAILKEGNIMWLNIFFN